MLNKNSIDSLTFKPVLEDVLKHPQNSLVLENSSNSVSSTVGSSKRSSLFSTRIDGILLPSGKDSTSSTAFFHFIELFNILII